MSYYDNQQAQWGPAAPQNSWEQQTPPSRSATSSATIPRENESNAFLSQFEEVDKAQDNLLKSGKVFAGMPGARRESLPHHGGPPRGGRPHPVHDTRMGPGAGSRPHSAADFGEPQRGGHNNQSNLQTFYAAQRHQTSRGSNEAEQMMQAKRRMAAQRERELRNYHQEQQYNRTVLSDLTTQGTNKPERALSPGSMSEDERRKLIARQRSALYGEGPYVDETGTPHLSAPPNGPASLRGNSPLAYEFGRTPPAFPQGGPQPPAEAQANDPARTNSTSSPQPNAAAQQQQQQQSSLTSVSPPAGSPSLGSGGANSKPGQGPSAVAPIGTRPAQQRSTPPGPSSLNQGYGTSDNDNAATGGGGQQSNPSSAAGDARNGSLWGGRNTSVWGNSSSSGQQASVWGAA